MKAIHEVVQKELELQKMLKDAVREKELGLRELQKLLLSALYIVNKLLDENPAEIVAGQREMVEPEPCQDTTMDLDAAPGGIARVAISPLESGEAPVSDSFPRDLP